VPHDLGLAPGPGLRPLASPHQPGTASACTVRGHHAWARPEQHGGELVADAMTAKVSNKPRGNGHWISAYIPLQENLGGEAGKGVLTEGADSAAARVPMGRRRR
jgi:hypothetical protein